MQELRFVAVSEDGSYAVLAVPGRSGRYILPIDERLRAVALGQTSRLAQYEIEVESPLRPKEIQARIRAGETAEEIADAAGIPVERVRWFEGPVLAERAYIADQAQVGSVRRAGDSSGPGPRLGEIVTARLTVAGTDPADGQWDSRKRGDGNWQVSLTFPSGGRLHVAEWVFDPRRRHVMPDDDNAARLSLPESDLPPEPLAVPGEATVTPIASRLGAAAGMGGGGMGGGGYATGPAVSRFRPDRSVLPDRSLGADRSLADRPAAPAAPQEPPSRHAQQDRPGHQDRRSGAGYAEFPESAPYRGPEPTEPPARRDLAKEPAAHHATAEPQGQQRTEAGRGYDEPALPSATHPAQTAEPGYREPAARQDPVPRQPAVHDAPSESAGGRAQAPVAPRPVVFEDPEPALLGEELEPAGARSAPAPAASAAGPGIAGQATARPAPGPSAESAAVATPETVTARATVPAATVAPEAVAARTEPSAAVPPATAVPAAAQVPAAAPAAAPAAPEPSVPAADASDADAEPSAAEDASARPRPGAKKTAKGRRSSVPSWDEIMLGSSRPRD